MTFGTMELIQTVTVGSGGAANIDFTNIPQTYDDLLIKYSLRNNSGVATIRSVRLRVNGNSSNIYSARILDGDGSGIGSGNNSSQSSINWGGWANDTNSTANTFSNCETYIPNYRSSTDKSVSMDAVAENNAPFGQQRFLAGLIATTSAITQVTLEGEVNFVQHSTATLYGITRIPAGAKATGGAIYDDANFFYHVFTSSGTFTPSQNLSCEYLVVAGGGGGGSYAGGGGAGGLRNASGFSILANTNYTVTIGAGGAAGSNGFSGTAGGDSVFSTITSTGGGLGGGSDSVGGNGGSGGGGGGGTTSTSTSGGSGSQGNNGGSGSGEVGGVIRAGGGGGGAGAVGSNASTDDAGNGGAGSSSFSAWGLATLTGQNVSGTYFYAGGGGGGADSRGASPTVGIGGNGGGANGTITSTAPSNALANTGGGGGGGTYSGTLGAFVAGSSGGSGIVIVRYAK